MFRSVGYLPRNIITPGLSRGLRNRICDMCAIDRLPAITKLISAARRFPISFGLFGRVSRNPPRGHGIKQLQAAVREAD